MGQPRLLFIRIIAVLSYCLLVAPHTVNAQPWDPDWFTCNNVSVSNCVSTVPSLFVDLSDDPNQKWYSCLIQRGPKQDTCCGFSPFNNNDQCIEFKILLHPETESLIFEIPESSEPEWQTDKNHPAAPGSPGAKPSINVYRINCGPLIGGQHGSDPACLTTAILNDTVFITYCQTGNNPNVYRIKAIKGEINPDLVTIQEGPCGGDLKVETEDIDISSITWTSLDNPAYDAYLSATCCTDSVTVFVPNGADLSDATWVGGVPILTYEVCGDPIDIDDCPSASVVCAEVQVLVIRPPSVTAQDIWYCPGSPYYLEVIHPTRNIFEYWWYDGPNGTGSLVSTGIGDFDHNFPTAGTKSVVYEDPTVAALGLDPACTSDTINITINLYPVPPAQIIPPAFICIDTPYDFEAVDAGAGATYDWNFGSGASPSTHTGTNNNGRFPPSVTYSTCGSKTITLTVTSADGCDSTTMVTVPGDTDPPVITCPADITVECDESVDPANTGTATATDNCDYTITYNDVIIPGACTGDYIIQRTWTATDPCGLTDDCLQTITVQDNTPPTLTCNVTDLILECDQDYAAEINTWLADMEALLLGVATDNCGPVSVSNDYSGPPPPLSCDLSSGLVVTFTISDDCGNSVTCQATIYVDDTTPPTVDCVVTDLVLECDQDYAAEINTWLSQTENDIMSSAGTVDDCGQPLSISNDYDGSLPTLDCNGATGLAVTFTVTDACGNITTCVGNIIIDDTQPPVVNCVVTDLTLECDQDYDTEINNWITQTENDLLANSSDDCGGTFTVTNDWDGSYPTLDCDAVTGLTVTFTVLDACLNPTTCTGLIIIDDTQPPIVNCVVTDLTLECDQDYVTEINNWITQTENDILANSSDDCGQPLTISNDWDGTIPTLDCNGATGVTVTFTIEDACL
ncbi:MAG: PKD domain-containing protein, partial [Saprospiraceae bacterium]|nr:PKD domain-containing protein [Saprospiraceae bacterium]